MLPVLQRLLSRAGIPAAKRGEPATRALGRRGERLAASHLRRQGYRVLARNLRTPIGEADIVCLAPDRRTVVVVEVKSRLRRPRPAEYPGPSARRASVPAAEHSITARKRRKLLHVAQDIARRRRWTDRPLRIDVVAVEWSDPRARPEIRHHPSAVTLND